MASKIALVLASAAVLAVEGFGGVSNEGDVHGGDTFIDQDMTHPGECINPPDAPVKPDCEDALEQSPAEVTKGSVGLRDPTGTVITDYAKAGMCMVNIHWHLGAEHKSEGQYDIAGQDFLDNVYK